jgi:phosphopantothenate-cysteine ligase
MMNILVTAGSTAEKIDDTRRVSNTGTGKLGALIAESFVAAEEACEVTYVCSIGAVRPRILGGSNGSIDVRIADDVRSLVATLEKACADKKFDAIVHTMAVSDYYVGAVTNADKLSEAVIETTRGSNTGTRVIKNFGMNVSATKIRETIFHPPEDASARNSNDSDNMVVVLHRAPKLISHLRVLAPEAVITAFNLMVNATEGELLSKARKDLDRYHLDFVLSNDMTTVRSNRQEGYLVTKEGTHERAIGKGSIAMMIVLRTLQEVREKE